MADPKAARNEGNPARGFGSSSAGEVAETDDDFEPQIIVRTKQLGKLKQRKKKALAQEFTAAIENGHPITPRTNHFFRTRPVEIGDELPVVRLSAQDAAGSEYVNNPIPTPEKSCAASEASASHSEEVFVPNVRRVPDRDGDPINLFRQPKALVRYELPTKEELDSRVLYDLDDEDMEFLRQLTNDKKRNVRFNFHIWLFM